MIEFEKYHGTGNDFIFSTNPKLNNPKIIKKICDRHFGIGADGVMIPEKSTIADIKMVYYNQDGTIAPMCGNGIRCFSKFIYQNNLIDKRHFHVETGAGLVEVKLDEDNLIHVFLNNPCFNLKKSEVVKPINGLNQKLVCDNETVMVHILVLGTIHTVVFLDENPGIDLKKIGPKLSNHSFFSNQTNVNFVEVVNDQTLKVTTYERGCGWTLSCGTGSCASAVVSSLFKKTKNLIRVIVPGGELTVNVGETVELIGPAEKIASGVFEV